MSTGDASPSAPARTSALTANTTPGRDRGSLGDRIGRKVNPVARKGILLATHNRPISAFVRRYGLRLGARQFVAGTNLDEVVVNLRRLNGMGMRTNTTILGEALRDRAAVERVVDQYIVVLDRIAAEGLQTNLAVKLTQLGLDNTGTVFQSYLYRAADDLERLAPRRPSLRLVKGAYLEPPQIAFPRKTDIDDNYLRLAKRMFETNSFTAIATHDDRLIEELIRHAEAHDIPKDRYEFQMLYGIRPQLQQDLVRRGYRVLIATPFGPEWYFFYMRRLAERPANVLNLVRSVVRPS